MSEPVCLQAEAPSPRKREHDAPKSKNPFILQASIITHAMLVFLAINSIKGENVVVVNNYYLEKNKVGNLVVVLGGGLSGCECAVHLGMEGKTVHLVEMRDSLAVDCNVRHRPILMKQVEQYCTTHLKHAGQRIIFADMSSEKAAISNLIQSCALVGVFSLLLIDEIQPFEALFFEKGRNLTMSIVPGIHVQGSDKNLRQLLGILLDNALKYSTADGNVKVGLSRHGGHCTLSVANPGDEISREDLTNIFKQFYRVDKTRGMKEGYGLGLSIAQSIANVHKGKIWAESQNGINTFFVNLPTIA